jgi:hypothetical protein
MTPVKVRFPCEHGVWFTHYIKPVGPGRSPKCEGGFTRMLEWREECCTRCGADCDDHQMGVWVEVNDENC